MIARADAGPDGAPCAPEPAGAPLKRIAVLRCHAFPDLCSNRLQLLRLFNPGVDLIGLYGGDERRFAAFAERLGPHLDGVYCIRGKSLEWKWRNGDLALYLWHRDEGHARDFDVLHLVEWDLLLLAPLAALFGHVPSGGLGLGNVVPASEVKDTWVWIAKEPYRSQWAQLLRHVAGAYGYAGEPLSCICAGATLPRAFLDRCAAEQIPELCNDEARLPLFAQAFGFSVTDNGIHDPSRRDEERCFNLRARDIRDEVIREELMNKNGRRAFHPYRRHFARLAGSGLFPNLFSLLVRKLSGLQRRRLNMPKRIGAR